MTQWKTTIHVGLTLNIPIIKMLSTRLGHDKYELCMSLFGLGSFVYYKDSVTEEKIGSWRRRSGSPAGQHYKVTTNMHSLPVDVPNAYNTKKERLISTQLIS